MKYQMTQTIEAHYWDGIGGNLPDWLANNRNVIYHEETGNLDVYDASEGGYLPSIKPNTHYIVNDNGSIYSVMKEVFEKKYKPVK